ncbi:hypothetical protein E4U41_005852, partial [Claviceps citrina]
MSYYFQQPVFVQPVVTRPLLQVTTAVAAYTVPQPVVYVTQPTPVVYAIPAQ